MIFILHTQYLGGISVMYNLWFYTESRKTVASACGTILQYFNSWQGMMYTGKPHDRDFNVKSKDNNGWYPSLLRSSTPLISRGGPLSLGQQAPPCLHNTIYIYMVHPIMRNPSRWLVYCVYILATVNSICDFMVCKYMVSWWSLSLQ